MLDDTKPQDTAADPVLEEEQAPPKMGAEQAAEFRALAAEAAGDPGQAGPGPAPGEPSTKELLAPLVSFTFDALAPAWNVQQAEKEALTEAYAGVIDKYWPEGVGAFGVELNALLITAAILGPRMRLPRFPTAAPEAGQEGTPAGAPA